MKTVVSLILALLSATAVWAQREAENWYFGSNSGVTFQSGAPVYLAGGMLNSAEGCASVSDRSTGALLFYTDGVTIWNSSHQIMPNGTGLRGGTSSTQTAIIVPNPANTTQYYVFTAPNLTAGAPLTFGFYYNLVSMATPSGNVVTKNVALLPGTAFAEKVTATKDCGGQGYWVITHDNGAGRIYAFHVTASGVDPNPVVSSYLPTVATFTAGYIKISPNGAYLAVGSSLGGLAYLGLFDFDTQTGVASNHKTLHPGVGDSFYGLSFSPDNSKLYATGRGGQNGLFQFEVNAGDAAAIRNSMVFMQRNNAVGKGMQLGPDGKLYIATGLPYLDVVQFPNLKGTACSYQPNAIGLVNTSQRGLPNNLDFLVNDVSSVQPIVKEICKGNWVQIGVLPTEGRVYSWSPPTGLSDPNIANPYASPTSATEYVLNMSSAVNGCFVMAQRYIINIRTTTAIVNANIPPLCAGQSVQLSASGGDRYEWTPAQWLTDPSLPNPVAKPPATTKFRVIVYKNGCPDTAYVTVEIKQRPIANVGENKVVCLGQSVRIGGDPQDGFQYSWTPTQGLDLPASSNPIASPKKTTVYFLQTLKNGCIADTAVTVTVKTVKAVVSPDVTICAGGSAKLTASGGIAYSWTPATGLNNKFLATPVATPAVTTRYKVVVSDGMCLDSAFVTVTVAPLPKANAGIDKTVCRGAAAQLGAPADSGCTYKWLPATELDNPNIANPVATPTQTRQYILTVTNAANCTAKDTVMVNVGNITAKVSRDTSVCLGGTAHLIASGGSEYVWTPAAGLDNPAIPTPKATPLVTTLYKVRVTSGVCVDSAFVQVNVMPLPKADAGADIEVCPGETAAIGTAAVAGYSYSWAPSEGLDNPTIAMPKCSATSPTQYILTVITPAGCSALDTVMVGTSTLQAGISPDTTICPGATVQLLATGGSSYQWSPPDGLDNPNIPNPLASPATTTVYTVDIENARGCRASARVTVSVSPSFLTASVSDSAVCLGAEVRFAANGGSGYSWSPAAGLDNPNSPNPTGRPDSTTTYRVTAINGNCRDTAFVTVAVLPLPVADAGGDTTICIGEAAGIGRAPATGHTYSWTPAEGLDNPNSANPSAKPTAKTAYILAETNQNGCMNYDTVTVDIRQRYELAFALVPEVIPILPGENFTATLHIPAGVQTWTAQLDYNSQLIGFDSILHFANGITATAQANGGVLTIDGEGDNGDVRLGFRAYLPEHLDADAKVLLGITSYQSNRCDFATARGAVLDLGEFCAKNFRLVSGTGKRYFLRANEHGFEFGVGLSGRVRLELYDYAGRLREVIADSFVGAGDYAVDMQRLPTGVYFCRMTAGAFYELAPLVIVR